jgi:hypothetical protein
MLMWFLGDFVNFTGVNSQILSPNHKCKQPSRDKNRRFASPPRRLKTQITRGSQSRIRRWQNTIFSFLEAQLDFLAIFSTLPYNHSKYSILGDSSGFSICHKFTNSFYLSVFSMIFGLFARGDFFYLKNSKMRWFAVFSWFFGFWG